MQTIHALVNQQVGPVEQVSPSTVVPAGITDIECQLVLATSAPRWTTNSVQGAVWEWQIERLNPATGQWELLVGETTANGNALAVGQVGKNGGEPRMGVSRVDLAGMTVRAWARCSVTIFVSVDIIIGP